MILDTSAVLAVLFREPEHDDFVELILSADICRMSVVSRVELAIVLAQQAKPGILSEAESLLRAAQIVEEPVTLEQGQIARDAFYRYGRGRHRARLNFRDCFSYALAKALREPLLFKGTDFSHTDIARARKG